MASDDTLEQILDLARWAPSGDNTQPWRFERAGDLHVVVHGFDTRDHCVYDLTGHPSQLSLGALLETMRIAASGHGLRTLCERRREMPETRPTFDVRFEPDPAIAPDPLAAMIRQRSVQRRAMSNRALTAEEKRQLEAAAGSGFRIQWLEGSGRKLEAAKLMFDNARLRLSMPEAYEVHRAVIEWNARYSEDRVPDAALGVDPLTARTMRFVMKSWDRVAFFNRYLAGTVMPRIVMDFIPGLACGAHFALRADRLPETIDDFVAAGRAVQRFWLTVTRLGLVMQPEMTPLIFSGYVRDGIRFTRVEALEKDARKLVPRLEQLLGSDWSHAVWLARVGEGSLPSARSTRLPLARLMQTGAASERQRF
jgi:hypothetical protein